MQIKSKSNLKLALITLPALDSELSSAEKRMREKNHQDIWKKCLHKMPLNLVSFGCLLCIGSTAVKKLIYYMQETQSSSFDCSPLSLPLILLTMNSQDICFVFHLGTKSDF